MDEHLDTILYIVLTIFLILFSIFRKKKKLSEQVAGAPDELLTQSQSSDDWESSDDYEQNNEVKNVQNLLDLIKPDEAKNTEIKPKKSTKVLSPDKTLSSTEKDDLITEKSQLKELRTYIKNIKNAEVSEAFYEEIENFDLKTAVIYSEILNRKYG